MKSSLFLLLFLFSLYLPAQINWEKTYLSDRQVNPRDMVIQDSKILVGGYYIPGAFSSSRRSFVLTVDLLNGDSTDLATCISGADCSWTTDILAMAISAEGSLFAAGNQSFGPT